MLTPQQMETALCAIALIDAQALYVMTSKLVRDIEGGRYTEEYEITGHMTVGDLMRRGTWRKDMHILAVITSVMAGQLMRIACEKSGVIPMSGSWQQLLTLAAATTHIEQHVVKQLLQSHVSAI